MMGIIQEQHPDRARLFMQWKDMHWPLLVDSYNLLEVPYVPITLAIDEHGIIRAVHPPLQEPGKLDEFLNRSYDPPARRLPRPRTPDLNALRRAAESVESAGAWRAYGDAAATWAGVDSIDAVIEAYRRATTLEPEHELSQFRLGVAYRMRYDSDHGRPSDFQQAIEHWSAALEIDPNQYIFRRRIEQYGPRLAKPYPFYDWVTTARAQVEARGETPSPLGVEPGGAEFASPASVFQAARAAEQAPDPDGRVMRDDGQFILVETTTVPRRLEAGASARAHVVFRPIPESQAHWNNEVGDLLLWIDPPRGWEASAKSHSIPNPPELVSQEIRKVEFELRAPESATPGSVTIPGYALYYVCEDINGVCMYRRQDVRVSLDVRKPASD